MERKPFRERYGRTVRWMVADCRRVKRALRAHGIRASVGPSRRLVPHEHADYSCPSVDIRLLGEEW